MHIKEILIKLSVWLFLIKDDRLLEKYNEACEKATLFTKNLIATLYTMENI